MDKCPFSVGQQVMFNPDQHEFKSVHFSGDVEVFTIEKITSSTRTGEWFLWFEGFPRARSFTYRVHLVGGPW